MANKFCEIHGKGCGCGKRSLDGLKVANDFEVIETREEQYYAGCDGPRYRGIPVVVRAFGKTWDGETVVIDRANDCQYSQFTSRR